MTSEFLTRAAIYREVDTMNTPSSCIIMGRPIRVGTGICQLRQVVEPQGAAVEEAMAIENTEGVSSGLVVEKEDAEDVKGEAIKSDNNDEY